MTVKWAGSKESCMYELRLVSTPPTITMSKAPGMCALKPPGNMVFKVLRCNSPVLAGFAQDDGSYRMIAAIFLCC